MSAMGELVNKARAALSNYDRLECDLTTISQDALDLSEKSRSSLFSWRGQFSPQLVERFLDKYASQETIVLDPFAGMGTTLFECARKGIICYGKEINPAAFEMARTAEFCNLAYLERLVITDEAKRVAQNFVNQVSQAPEVVEKGTDSYNKLVEETTRLLRQTSNKYVQSILVNALIRCANGKELCNINNLLCALEKHIKIIHELPLSYKPCRMYFGDARDVLVDKSSIDLIITSPPYINVFNYHQNHRPVMELLGWKLLDVAKSEFGSNRKNRGNRFLTAIQYAIDMYETLVELRTLLREDGRIIIVVGRESKIRGVSFLNGRLVSAIASGGAGYTLETRQQRKFQNKFGQVIVEDILHLIPNDNVLLGDDFAKEVARVLLREAVSQNDIAEEVNLDLLDAINRSEEVSKSPILKGMSYEIPY